MIMIRNESERYPQQIPDDDYDTIQTCTKLVTGASYS